MRIHIPFLYSVLGSDKTRPIAESLGKLWMLYGRRYSVAGEGRMEISGIEL